MIENMADEDEAYLYDGFGTSGGSDDARTTSVPTTERIEPGRLFHWLNPSDPEKARHRMAILYWRGWNRVIMSFFLAAFGLTFLIIGLLCMQHCDDFDRGVAFLIIGIILMLPGGYGVTVLVLYLRGRKGVTYEILPDMSS